MSAHRRRLHPGRPLGAAAVSLTLLLSLGGCAGTEPPAQAVPELHTALSRVDRAIVHHQPGQARRQLRQLIRTTVAARHDGRLDATQADGVLAAAARLLDALPRPETRPEPVPTTPAPQPEPTRAAPQEDNKGPGNGQGHGNHGEGNGGEGGESGEGD